RCLSACPMDPPQISIRPSGRHPTPSPGVSVRATTHRSSTSFMHQTENTSTPPNSLPLPNHSNAVSLSRQLGPWGFLPTTRSHSSPSSLLKEPMLSQQPRSCTRCAQIPVISPESPEQPLVSQVSLRSISIFPRNS